MEVGFGFSYVLESKCVMCILRDEGDVAKLIWSLMMTPRFLADFVGTTEDPKFHAVVVLYGRSC